MKKLYFYLVAAVMMIGATACQQDAVEGVKNEKPSFTATLNGTRTELGEGNKVMWNADDKITVYTQENTAGVVFDGDATEAAATAKFTTTEEFAASTTGYFAVYPNQTEVATYDNGVWSVPVALPDIVDGVNGTFLENNPMAAFSTDNSLSFKAATAIIKFTYKGSASDGYADFMAMGTDLVGTKILKYDTTENTISYDSNGSFTMFSANSLKDGETYYIPIFPGTVNSFTVTLDTGAEYNLAQSFEFKAGKIYSVNLPELSDWTIKDTSAFWGASTTLLVSNGLLVAKNLNWGEAYAFIKYEDNGDETRLTASKEIVLGEWQATTPTTDTGFMMPEGSMFDVYLAPDASMMCVVPAGETIPSLYHIYAYNSSKWDNVNIYACDADWNAFNGLWPGLAMSTTMVGEVEYYVYDIPNKYIGQQINFIFNSGAGAQTADLSATVNGDLFYYTNGDVVEDPANPIIPEAKKLYLVPNSNWKTSNARFAAYFFGAGETWVGMTDEDKDGTYECEIPEGYPNVIFCRMNPNASANNWDNKWNQTADLTVPTDGTNCYTVKEGSWDKGGGTWSTK